MSQYGEGTKTQNIYVEKPEDKEEMDVRLTLFYDGTLNNRVNVEEREKAKINNLLDSVYHDHKTDNGNNSYDNGRTNIAIMEPHLRKESDGFNIALKGYIEGQGTFNLEGDDIIGYSMGGASSGVADRAVLGIDRGVGLIYSNFDPDDFCIKRLVIDVFGFSRGSATARYAIHLLLKGSTKWDSDYGDGYEQVTPPILELIANRGIEISENAVEICFAGLYDTVLSVYLSQYLPALFVSNKLQQKAVKHAKKVLHLAAADEHRSDFPLHNIKSAGSKGEEYFLPGVHSDVGGSYNAASELALKSEVDPNKKVHMKRASENKLIRISSRRKKIERDMDILIKQGWYLNDNKEIKIIDEKIRKKRAGGKVSYNGYIHKLKVHREGICTAYCNIPLKIMAKYARDKDVKLKLNSKLNDRAGIILKPHKDLAKLEKKIKQYIKDKKGNGISQAKDWNDEKEVLNKYIFDNNFRHNHFNFSSKVAFGYFPRIKKGKRLRYVYEA